MLAGLRPGAADGAADALLPAHAPAARVERVRDRRRRRVREARPIVGARVPAVGRHAVALVVNPPLAERMQNVGHTVGEQDYSAIVTRAPEATWIPDIPTADSIEQRLWGVYEQQFAAAHEQQLAYRYRPATDEERALVLKYFPPVEFALRGGKRVGISKIGRAHV